MRRRTKTAAPALGHCLRARPKAASEGWEGCPAAPTTHWRGATVRTRQGAAAARGAFRVAGGAGRQLGGKGEGIESGAIGQHFQNHLQRHDLHACRPPRALLLAAHTCRLLPAAGGARAAAPAGAPATEDGGGAGERGG